MEVFTHSRELLDMGLDIPQLTAVFLRLQEMGLDIPEITRVFLKLQQKGLPVRQVYTVEQAVAELTRLKGGCDHA